eukprot:TRINITY_DN1028_c0_g1_i3.p1 TRINITY_DN1028_c0_g1~~TRINITY_DN1028_c0_g1_i3.p1  ORF type:complete len:378 (+),score=57.46 TRINITY_DN1028_c0_g1_i3:81-1214(+)
MEDKKILKRSIEESKKTDEKDGEEVSRRGPKTPKTDEKDDEEVSGRELKIQKVEEAQVETQEQKRSRFFKEKGMFKDDEVTATFYLEMINNADNLSPQTSRMKYKSAQGRLDRILAGRDKTNTELPLGVQSFQEFCQVEPKWIDKEQSFVFFRDHPKVVGKECLAQRSQLSGLCYLHGPDMMQHYLVAMNNAGPVGIIDLCAMIAENFTPEQLQNHICYNNGGNSRKILQDILVEGTKVLEVKIDDVVKTLREYGPILVSRFNVYTDFKSSCKHCTQPTGAKLGQHSMVLIGSRQEGGTTFFLLQNWWKKQQFIEVDRDYLLFCQPMLYYVEEPQLAIPEKFLVDFKYYGENDIDVEETMEEPEGPIKGIDGDELDY